MSPLPALVCLVLVATVASALPDSHWALFKSMHGKTYANQAEETMRREIFAANKERVDHFNAHHSKDAGYEMGLNHMSDWTEEEFAKTNGFRQELVHQNNQRVNSPDSQAFLDEILNDDSPIPESVDWRLVPNRVSAVKDQGQCGSCWAFATTGLLEGQENARKADGRLATGAKLDPLSEQNLVDCSRDNRGCMGGIMSNALQDIATLGGLEDETSYPYEASSFPDCRFNKSKSVFTDKGYAMLPYGDEEALKKTVARYGPVAVGIYASTEMRFYKSGILDDDQCDIANVNHAVLVVGYGSQNGSDYWIVKNSWGSHWGAYGYLFMSRNKENQCYIASYATIATF